MFDLICIAVAGVLAATSLKQYRSIATVLFLGFIGQRIAYIGGIVLTDAFNPWLLYLAYATIQVHVMALLYIKKSHFVISALVFMQLLYNLGTIYAYFDYDFVGFYNNYPLVVGSIMILELMYLGTLNKYVNRDNDRRNNDSIIANWLFRIRRGDIDGCLP